MEIFPNGPGSSPRILLLGGTSEIGLAILSALAAPAQTQVILAGRDEQRLAAAGKPLPYQVRTHDYDAFARVLLAERKGAELPPFSHVALLMAEAHARETVDRFLAAAHAAAITARGAGFEVTVFAPVPALLAKRGGYERGQLVVQATRRPELQRFLPVWHAALHAIPGRRVRWALDVDPPGF